MAGAIIYTVFTTPEILTTQSIILSMMVMMLTWYYYLFLLPLADAFSSKDVLRSHISIHRRVNERCGEERFVYRSSSFVQPRNLITRRKQSQTDKLDFVSRNENRDDAPSVAEKPRKRDRLKKLFRIRGLSSREDKQFKKEQEHTTFFEKSKFEPKRGSVFAESKTMLALSDMIYSFVKLRAYAQTHNDEALQQKLEVPQISSTLTPTIIENLPLLNKGQRFETDFIERAKQTVNQAEFAENSKENSEVIYVGDSSRNLENSCVYGIGVNRSEKRITVWFRGTVMEQNGLNHWEKNFDTTLRLEENPIDELLDSIPTFHLHRGFVRSFLGNRRKIMLRILQYRKDHPETADFPLFVSGHSLGGALATLFGFYASLEPEFTKNGPVRVYTFAAPPVGDRKFGQIFRHQEETGKIRLARIHNANDPVPSAFSLTRYKHVGLGIELDFSAYEIDDEDRSSAGKIAKIFGGRREHKLQRSYEYLKRHAIGFNSTLDEMYQSKMGI